MKRVKNWIGNKLLDFIDWIFENRPEGESLTINDIEARQKAREMRKDFQ